MSHPELNTEYLRASVARALSGGVMPASLSHAGFRVKQNVVEIVLVDETLPDSGYVEWASVASAEVNADLPEDCWTELIYMKRASPDDLSDFVLVQWS